MRADTEGFYNQAWCMVRIARFDLPDPLGGDEEFRRFVDKEHDALCDQVKGMVSDKTIGDTKTDRDRWYMRLAIIRAASFVQTHWEGQCVDCGCIVNAANTATPDRTICDDCANKGTPARSPADLFALMVECFPGHQVPGKTFSTWDDDARRQIGSWLDKVLLGTAVAGCPTRVRPFSHLLGTSMDGQLYYQPPDVESDGGELPPRDEAMEAERRGPIIEPTPELKAIMDEIEKVKNV